MTLSRSGMSLPLSVLLLISLPQFSLSLSASYAFLTQPAIICVDATHEYPMAPFSSLTCEAFFTLLSTFIVFVCLEPKSCPAAALSTQETLCCLLPVSAQARWRVAQRGMWPPNVVSNLGVCGSQWVGVRLGTNWPEHVRALQSPADAWTAARTGEGHSEEREGAREKNSRKEFAVSFCASWYETHNNFCVWSADCICISHCGFPRFAFFHFYKSAHLFPPYPVYSPLPLSTHYFTYILSFAAKWPPSPLIK